MIGVWYTGGERMCDNWASYGGNVGEDTEGKGETLIHDSALIVHTTNVYDATVWCRVPESTLQTELSHLDTKRSMRQGYG